MLEATNKTIIILATAKCFFRFQEDVEGKPILMHSAARNPVTTAERKSKRTRKETEVLRVFSI